MCLEIYSTDTDAGSVSVVSVDGERFALVASIDVGNAPRGAVKFTGTDRGYVSNCGGDTISEIDLVTHREVGRIRVGPAPRGIGMVPNSRFALVSNSGDDSVSIVDLEARSELRRVQTGRDPRHMTVLPTGEAAYVAIWRSHYVAKIDTSPLVEAQERGADKVREVANIEIEAGAHPYSVADNAARDELYVANTQAPYVSVISTRSDTIDGKVSLTSKGSRAIALSDDGRLAYVSIEDSSEVAVIDLESRAVLQYVAVGPGPRGIALKGDFVCTSSFTRTKARAVGTMSFTPNSLTIVRIDESGALIEKGEAYREVPVGAGPCSVAILETQREVVYD